MICPYCRHEHKLNSNITSLKIFINSIIHRINYEQCLTSDDCDELLSYLNKIIINT